mgnify:CR=1 FL=1
MKFEAFFYWATLHSKIGRTFRRKKVENIHHDFNLSIRFQYI